MVTGNEIVFDNIDLALAFILKEEKKYLNIDERKRKCRELPFLLRVPIDSLKNPFTTWDNNGSDDQFVMTPLGSGRYSLKPNLCNRGYLFRGESEFHSPCKPSLFRKQGQVRFTKELLEGQEMSLLMMKHPLVELLDSGVTLCGQPFSFEMNLFGLSQHYSNKTSLMDLTSDPSVAAFFAITKSVDEAKFIIVENEDHSPGVLYYYELDEINDFKGASRLSTIGLQVFPRSGKQKGFLYDMNRNDDFNDIGRLRAVKFKHNKEIAERIYNEFDGGKRLFPDDILSAHWSLVSRNPNTISNRTIRLNMHFNSNLTQQDIELEARKLGFTIKDYQPSFTKEELDKYYYEEIKNGMWQSFCDQIFIPGDINGRMKSDLMNLPNRTEYKWAFESGHNHTPDYNKGYLLKQYRDCLE